MAKIIYGVSGQGFGHSTRSKEILKYLASQGHEILIFTYGQAVFFLADEFEVFEVPGLGLSYKDNKVVYLGTIYANIKQLAKQSRNWTKISRRFKEFNPDIVITDFEPLVAILAKLNRLPLISIDNQHQLTNTKINVNSKYKKDLLADRLIIKSMVWGAKYYLVTSFFQTPIKRQDTFLFPPIVRQEVLDLKSSKGDYFLVYQTSKFDGLIRTLKSVNHQFVFFGSGSDSREGNITFKSFDSREWLKYLAGCRAIIGNAGLSLISESLYLGKPYLAIPLGRQIEQIINAQYLQQMGYGRFTHRFSRKVLDDFIEQLPKYEKNLSVYNHSDNKQIFKKIDELVGGLV